MNLKDMFMFLAVVFGIVTVCAIAPLAAAWEEGEAKKVALVFLVPLILFLISGSLAAGLK